MNRKLLFFDIDGTLLTEDDRRFMPDSTREAILKARERGHRLLINSGRVKSELEQSLYQYGFDGFVCGCGTHIEYEGRSLYEKRLDKKLCEKVVTLNRKAKTFPVYESTEQVFTDSTLPYHRKIDSVTAYLNSISPMPVGDVGEASFQFQKFTVWLTEETNCDLFLDEIGRDFQYIRRADNFGEVVPRGHTKASGISFLCKYFGEDLEDCYAFGDSNNDLEMLSYVPHSIGMGNSTREVLDIVSHVTKTVEEDGIYLAMKHFGLI